MQRDWASDEKKCTFIVLDRFAGAAGDGRVPGGARRTRPPGDARGPYARAAMCGDVNLFFNDHDSVATCEIEVMVARTLRRRKGIAREALRAMMAYAVDGVLEREAVPREIGFANGAALLLLADSGSRTLQVRGDQRHLQVLALSTTCAEDDAARHHRQSGRGWHLRRVRHVAQTPGPREHLRDAGAGARRGTLRRSETRPRPALIIKSDDDARAAPLFVVPAPPRVSPPARARVRHRRFRDVGGGGGGGGSRASRASSARIAPRRPAGSSRVRRASSFVGAPGWSPRGGALLHARSSSRLLARRSTRAPHLRGDPSPPDSSSSYASAPLDLDLGAVLARVRVALGVDDPSSDPERGDDLGRGPQPPACGAVVPAPPRRVLRGGVHRARSSRTSAATSAGAGRCGRRTSRGPHPGPLPRRPRSRAALGMGPHKLLGQARSRRRSRPRVGIPGDGGRGRPRVRDKKRVRRVASVLGRRSGHRRVTVCADTFLPAGMTCRVVRRRRAVDVRAVDRRRVGNAVPGARRPRQLGGGDQTFDMHPRGFGGTPGSRSSGSTDRRAAGVPNRRIHRRLPPRFGGFPRPGVPPEVSVVSGHRSSHVLVRPLIDGEDVGPFILDTGASGLVISRAAANRLKLRAFGEVHVSGVAGKVPCQPRRAAAAGPRTDPHRSPRVHGDGRRRHRRRGLGTRRGDRRLRRVQVRGVRGWARGRRCACTRAASGTRRPGRGMSS